MLVRERAGAVSRRADAPRLRQDGLGLVGVGLVAALVLLVEAPWALEALAIGASAGAGLFCLTLRRRAWSRLGAFLLVWSAGDLLWVLGETATAPWAGLVADPVYLVGLPLALAGLLGLPRGRWEPGAGPRVLLDVLVISVPVVAMLVVVLPAPLGVVDLDAATAWLLVWPVVDTLMCSLAFVLSQRRGDRMRSDLSLLVLAFAMRSAGDAILLWTSLAGQDYLGSWSQVPFVLTPLLVGLAAAASRRRATSGPEHDGVARHATCRAVVVLPDVTVVVAGLVCIRVGPDGWLEWAPILLGALLAAVRYGVVAYDAQHVRETLEQRVLDRTARLAELTDRLELVVDSVDHGLLGLDVEGRVAFVNRASLDLLGLTSTAQVLGRPVCELVCPAPHDDCPLALAAQVGHAVERSEGVFRRADGQRVPVEVAVAPVPRSGGEDPLGCVVTFHDITERRAVEQSKQQFVTSVSHELRTPLAAIRGSLEMLADGDGGELPPGAVRLVATAERGSDRLSRLVDDLLDVERIVSGAFSVAPRPVDVADVVGDVVATLGDWASTKGVLLRTGSLEGTALADPHRVEQALTNLVANAVKFSDPGSDVHLSVVRRGPEVLVQVRDTGRGIPAGDLPHVFDRFHQVDEGDATERGGTGLGLAITRSIVERHGGQIWVESVLGAGSTFSFTLPTPVPAAVPASSGRPLASVEPCPPD